MCQNGSFYDKKCDRDVYVTNFNIKEKSKKYI